MKSVATVERDRVGDVALLLLAIEVLLSVTHFEEVIVLAATVLIVAILTEEARLLQRPLDVPEVVSGDGLEDSFLLRLAQRALVGLFEVLSHAVLFLANDTQFFVENRVEIVNVERRFVVLEFSNQALSEGFLIFFIDIPRLVTLGLAKLVQLLQGFLICSLESANFFFRNLVDDSTILISWGTDEWVNNTLHERSALIPASSITTTLKILFRNFGIV